MSRTNRVWCQGFKDIASSGGLENPLWGINFIGPTPVARVREVRVAKRNDRASKCLSLSWQENACYWSLIKTVIQPFLAVLHPSLCALATKTMEPRRFFYDRNIAAPTNAAPVDDKRQC